MHLTVAAIGRMKAGPERDLFDRYLARAEAAGRKLALSFSLGEKPESRAADAAARKSEEAAALLAALPAGAILIALDQAGQSLDSRAFAAAIRRYRDDGVRHLVFAIGGADGHGPALLGRAALRLAFGPLTWPHQLVRIMLAEQLYRAVTILAAHPYHRG
jgi:23S rRNA (pseudouridine1915-N3)-methyltransferase